MVVVAAVVVVAVCVFVRVCLWRGRAGRVPNYFL